MSSITVRTLSDAFRKDSGLGPVDRLVLNILDRTSGRYKACLLASKTIADRIGRSVRTVQLALKRLKEAGYIAVELTRKLNSGHRIHLLWRGGWYNGPEARTATGSERDDEDLDFGATDCAGRTQPVAPCSEVPPDPPIEAPEGNTTKETDDRPETSSSSGEVSLRHQEEDQPPQAEAAPILAKAAEVLGPDVATPGRVVAAIREHGADEVATVLEICQTRRQQDPAPLGWGFLMRVFRNREAEGRPPYRRPMTPAERAEAKSKAEGDKIRARRAKLREAFGPRPA